MVSIGKWLLYGLVGAFAVSALVDPARAQGTISAFSGVGTALGSLGGGIQSLFTGVGTGTAKLFNPLFTLRDLIYGPQAGVQVQSDIEQVTSTGNIQASQIAAQQRAIELDPAAPFTPITTGFGGEPLYSQQAAQQGAAQAATYLPSIYGGQFIPASTPALTITGASPGSTWSFLQNGATTISPETVAATNPGNAPTSGQGSNYSGSSNPAAAAAAAGYSTGSPTGE